MFVLAEAVADGHDVDWDRAESAADSPEQLQIVQQLRHLASIGALAQKKSWGPLEIRTEIGHGTFGTVYRAWDTRLERDVALKLLNVERLEDRTVSTVIREGRLLARVRHSNVVIVYGADVFDGRAGIWMEFVTGRTLKDIVTEHGPLGAHEAAIIGRDLCRALAAVHKEGCLHRDVKAQNVMREAGGRTVLMDFGAGEASGVGSGSSAPVAGTPLYLAPEILAGGRATIQSDLYSLGVLLYHLVTGEFPVVGQSLGELRERHAQNHRTRLRDVRPDVPAAFVRAVERATATNPAERPESAGALEELLDGALGLPQTDERPAVRPPSRTAARLAAIVFALMLVTGLWFVATGVVDIRMGGTGSSPARAAPARSSVAVVPFRAVGSDPETVYYSEGLSDDLTAQLARLASVRVVSGVSLRRYRDTAIAPAQIGRDLNVETLVSGSVRLTKDRLHVVVELVDCKEAAQLWAGTFERGREEVVAVQEEVIQHVAAALKGSLSPQDASRLKRFTMDYKAFDLYLQARYFWNTRTPDGLRRSIQSFKQTVALAPQSALAYAGLSDAYALAAVYRVEPRSTAHREAEAAALTAIDLEPMLPEAHAALGLLRLQQFRWTEAESSLRRAIELNPSYASAHHWYSMWLTEHGRFEEAHASIRAARAADPFSQALGDTAAYIFYLARQFDRAVEQYKALLNVDPRDFQAHAGLVETHVAQGDSPAALQALENARRVTGRSDDLRLLGAYVYALAGDAPRARRLLADVEAALDRAPTSRAEIATVYGALGDRTRAFEWLDRAVDDQDLLLGYVRVDPRFDPLRTDPRFSTLLAKLQLND